MALGALGMALNLGFLIFELRFFDLVLRFFNHLDTESTKVH